MKKKILLVDESLTVQKVVALTLDKSRYALAFAKSRAEVMKWAVEQVPDLILISDQMADISAASFPKELETWLGGIQEVPPAILITSTDIKEQKHYAGVLRKPFTPQALQSLVNEKLKAKEATFPAQTPASLDDEFEDQRLHKIFNDTFADESTLMHETFHPDEDVRPVPSRPAPANDRTATASPPVSWGEAPQNLWDIDHSKKEPLPEEGFLRRQSPSGSGEVDNIWNMNEGQSTFAPESHPAMSAEAMGRMVEEKLGQSDINAAVDKVLSKIVPPIVERLVRERLDKLLAEQEKFVELKQ